jgi:hypothetical protein
MIPAIENNLLQATFVRRAFPSDGLKRVSKTTGAHHPRHTRWRCALKQWPQMVRSRQAFVARGGRPARRITWQHRSRQGGFRHIVYPICS